MTQEEVLKIIESKPGKEWTTNEIRNIIPYKAKATILTNLRRLAYYKEINHRTGKQNKIYYKAKQKEGGI